MMQIDVNLDLDLERSVRCRHCGTRVGTADDPFAEALRHQRDSRAAGPGVHADPASFSDDPIVLRQRFCPGCLTVLSTEIVPAHEAEGRGWRIG